MTMFRDSNEQEGRIATAIEDGRPHAALAFEAAFQRLDLLRRIMPRADDELLRLQVVVRHVLPAQTPQQATRLRGEGGNTAPLPSRRPCGTQGSGLRPSALRERVELEALATEIERLESDPVLGRIMSVREGLRILIPEQANVEIRRWMSMALTPGDRIVTNTGERLV